MSCNCVVSQLSKCSILGSTNLHDTLPYMADTPLKMFKQYMLCNDKINVIWEKLFREMLQHGCMEKNRGPVSTTQNVCIDDILLSKSSLHCKYTLTTYILYKWYI